MLCVDVFGRQRERAAAWHQPLPGHQIEHDSECEACAIAQKFW